MSLASDLNAIAPPPPWLKPAIDALRINQPQGIAPLCDRELAAILLMSLECDGPAPEVREAYGQVALEWRHAGRSLFVRIGGGKIYAGCEQVARRGWIDRVRGLVARVRGGCEDDTSKGE